MADTSTNKTPETKPDFLASFFGGIGGIINSGLESVKEATPIFTKELLLSRVKSPDREVVIREQLAAVQGNITSDPTEPGFFNNRNIVMMVAIGLLVGFLIFKDR